MVRRLASLLFVVLILTGCTTFGQGTIDVGPVKWTWGPLTPPVPVTGVLTSTPQADITVLPYGGIETMTAIAGPAPAVTMTGSALVLAASTPTLEPRSYPAPSTSTPSGPGQYPAPATATVVPAPTATHEPTQTSAPVSTATMAPPPTQQPTATVPPQPTQAAAPSDTPETQVNIFPLEFRCPTGSAEGLVKQTMQNPYSHGVTWQGELYADTAKVAGAPQGSLPIDGYQYGNLEWGVPVGFRSAHVTGWMKMFDGTRLLAQTKIDFTLDCTK